MAPGTAQASPVQANRTPDDSSIHQTLSMLPPMIRPATLALALASLASGQANEVGPPGAIALSGGRTNIGVDSKDIQKLIEATPSAAQNIRALDAETPEHTVDVPPFFIGVNELTNEQYAAFVSATGHRPPESWGKATIDAASQEFLREVGKKNQELRAANKPLLDTRFDRGSWWSENWKGAEWSIPDGQELYPVVYVDYADVAAYCRWAGVRLPTEFEYQHAVRGTRSSDPYPWGEEWVDGKFCSTYEDRKHTTTRPVGTFEEGSTETGIYELAGNVWEWTSSPYTAYEGFKENKYKIDGRTEKLPEPTWNGNKRVVVGGSFLTNLLAARCTFRKPAGRHEMTNALGFRIAGSTTPGADISDAAYTDIRMSPKRPGGVEYALNAPATMDRWESSDGSAGAPTGYSIIEKYEHMVFVPIQQIETSQDNEFRRDSLLDPQHIGFLSTSFGLQEPALAPGTYMITFRSAGATRLEDVAEGGEGEEGEEEGGGRPRAVDPEDDPWNEFLDINKDNLIFIDAATGEVAVTVPVEGASLTKGKTGGKIARFVKQIEIPDPEDPEEVSVIEEDWLKLEYRVKDKLRDHGLPINFEFKPEEGVLDRGWRM